MSFPVFVFASTKVADDITVGQKFKLDMLFGGPETFSVTKIDGKSARLISDYGTHTFLSKKEDGWHDSRIRIGAEALRKTIMVRVSDEL